MEHGLDQWELWAEKCLLSGLQYFFIKEKNVIMRISNHFQFHSVLFCFSTSIVQAHM
jgi:hypothetical protein